MRGLLTKPLATVITLVSVPLFLRYLGKEGYGLYQAIIAFSAQLALTNAGLSSGLVNKLTDCHVSGDRELARRPVITCRVGEVPAVLEEKAIYVDTTADAFADALERVMGAPALPDVNYDLVRHNWGTRAEALLGALKRAEEVGAAAEPADGAAILPIASKDPRERPVSDP